jgi:hypothetical protein
MCEKDTRNPTLVQSYHILHVRGKGDEIVKDGIFNAKIESPFHFASYDITYTSVKSPQVDDDFVKLMITLCKRQHVFLILDTFADPDVFQNFGTALFNYSDQGGVNLFKNVTILNICSAFSKTWKYYEYKDSILRLKFKFDPIARSSVKTYVFRKIIRAYPRFSTSDGLFNEVFTRDGGNRVLNVKNEVMQKVIEAKNIPENAWWFRYLFNVPSCAHFRLTQSTGTCWLNAILNMILFTPAVQILISTELRGSQTQQKIVAFEDFSKETTTLKDMIYSLFYHIVILKTKVRQDGINFLFNVGNRIISALNPELIKSGYAEQNPDVEGYFDRTCNVLRLLLEQVVPNLAQTGAFVTLQTTIPTPLKVPFTDVYDFAPAISAAKRRPPFISVCPKSEVNALIYSLPLILLGSDYELESATILLCPVEKRPSHMVCGYRCGKEWFVYDSNGINLRVNWYLHKREMANLFSIKYIEEGLEDDFYTFCGFSNAIYVPRISSLPAAPRVRVTPVTMSKSGGQTFYVSGLPRLRSSDMSSRRQRL